MLNRSRDSFDNFISKSELKNFSFSSQSKIKKRRENIHKIETEHHLERLYFEKNQIRKALTNKKQGCKWNIRLSTEFNSF